MKKGIWPLLFFAAFLSACHCHITSEPQYIDNPGAETANLAANLAYAQKDYEKAILLYRQAIFWNKTEPIYSGNLSWVYYQTGHFTNGIHVLEDAEERLPDGEAKNIILLQKANLLFDYGRSLKHERNFQEAMVFFQNALEIVRRFRPEDVAGFFHIADIYDNIFRFDQAIATYTELFTFYEQEKGEYSPELALILNDLSRILNKMGNYEQARRVCERAIAIDESYFGNNHPNVANGLNNLSLVYRESGNYEKARELCERALAIDESYFGNNHPNVAGDLNNLALVYIESGDNKKALELCERALAIDESYFGNNHPNVAGDLNNLAIIYRDFGKYEQAQTICERSLDIFENHFGKNHFNVANGLNNLAFLLFTLGENDRVLDMYERSLVTFERHFGNHHPDIANVLNNLAVLHWSLGDYEKAKMMYDRAIVIDEHYFGKNGAKTAATMNNLALLYEESGDCQKAKEIYACTMAIYEHSFGKDYPDMAVVLNNLALLNYKTGNYAQAQKMYEQAFSIAMQYNQPELLWRIQHGMSKALAMTNSPGAAIFFGKQAVNTIQSLRSAIYGMEKELQKSFIADKIGVYKDLADLLIDQGDLSGAEHVLSMLKEEEYFDFIKRNAEENSNTTRIEPNLLEKPWEKRYREINDQLAGIGKQIGYLKQIKTLSDAEKITLIKLQQDSGVAKQAFEAFLSELVTEIGKVSNQRAEEIGEMNLKASQAIQGTLRELGHGVVTLHYLVMEEKLRIILTTPDVQLVRDSIISAKDLRHKIHQFRKIIQKPTSTPFLEAKAMYEILIKPIENDLNLSDARTLMLSLDGSLRYLPFAALYDGKQYVAEKYSVVIYTEAAKDKLKDRPSQKWKMAGMGVSKGSAGYNSLPAVESELAIISKIIPGKIFLNEEFTADNLMFTLLEKYPVVHIASHFDFNPGTYKDSWLVLGDGNKLTLEAVKNDGYTFNGVDILTLSACNTGLETESANGQEIEGFGALAQKQGAQSVLATLWPVADESTSLFMQNMYTLHENMQGITKAESLQQAQVMFIHGKADCISYQDDSNRGRVIHIQDHDPLDIDYFIFNPDKPYAHPYYWAPFILMGNWL